MTIPLERFGAALCRHVKVRGTWARCIPIVCCLLLLLPPFSLSLSEPRVDKQALRRYERGRGKKKERGGERLRERDVYRCITRARWKRRSERGGRKEREREKDAVAREITILCKSEGAKSKRSIRGARCMHDDDDGHALRLR